MQVGVEVLGWAEAGVCTRWGISAAWGKPGPALEPRELLSLLPLAWGLGGLIHTRDPFGLLILLKEGCIFPQFFLHPHLGETEEGTVIHSSLPGLPSLN